VDLALVLDVLGELGEELRVLPLLRRRLLAGAPVVDVPVGLVEELPVSSARSPERRYEQRVMGKPQRNVRLNP